MKRIYTKKGDRGETDTNYGDRIPKDDIRIETLGTMEELIAEIGLIRSMLPNGDSRDKRLMDIQNWLVIEMGHVATPDRYRGLNPEPVPVAKALYCEIWMDEMESDLEDHGDEILLGGTPLIARMLRSRTVARRCERRLWQLNSQDPVPEQIPRLANRLGDLFLVLAQDEMARQNWDEETRSKYVFKKEKQK